MHGNGLPDDNADELCHPVAATYFLKLDCWHSQMFWTAGIREIILSISMNSENLSSYNVE